MSYLLNAWYVAAWTNEVDSNLFARTLLDTPVVIFRGNDGKAAAMLDLCPHRFAPLSMGTLVDGRVRCGYHGLEFDASGKCVGTCLNYAVPKTAKVRTFPTHEQDGIIWIWMGDDAPADTSTILRFEFLTDPSQRAVFGVMMTKIDYRLYIDNLLDLTHTSLLHPIFGGLNYQPEFKSWEEGDDVISQYTSEAPSSMVVGNTPVVVIDTMRWRAPGTHRLLTKISPKDTSIPGVEFPAAHIVTPETRTTTHYFWGSSIDKNSPMTDDQLRESLRQAFESEDKPMLEAVQNRMGDRDLFDMKPLLLGVDTSGVRARRKLKAMVERQALKRSNAMLETTSSEGSLP